MAINPVFINQRLASVGDVCIQWANVEYQVAHIIWCVLDVNMEVGKIVTGGLDMQPRLNVAIILAKQLDAPTYLIDGLVQARKDIQDGLDIKRNRAVHGVTYFDPALPTAMVELHRGKGPKTPVEFSNDDLEIFRGELNNLGNRLNQLFNQFAADEQARAAITITRKIR